MIKINKLIFIIKGKTYKNIKNTYNKCDKIPLLWRKFFMKIANNRDYVHRYFNRPLNCCEQHCRASYIYNSDNNLDELPDVGFCW